MKTSSSRRRDDSFRNARRTGSDSRARRRRSLSLEAMEDRVMLSLTPQTVLDVNTYTYSSNLSEIEAVGSTAYFLNGSELWKSDGSAAGTVRIKDIGGSQWPGPMTNVNGTLFFVAEDSTNGRELWKSDGTAAGTV